MFFQNVTHSLLTCCMIFVGTGFSPSTTLTYVYMHNQHKNTSRMHRLFRFCARCARGNSRLQAALFLLPQGLSCSNVTKIALSQQQQQQHLALLPPQNVQLYMDENEESEEKRPSKKIKIEQPQNTNLENTTSTPSNEHQHQTKTQSSSSSSTSRSRTPSGTSATSLK